jgi:ankyrin repeat protein
VDIAQVPLEHGTDVMAQDVDKSTPLHLESERGHMDIGRILLEYDADAEGPGHRGVDCSASRVARRRHGSYPDSSRGWRGSSRRTRKLRTRTS